MFTSKRVSVTVVGAALAAAVVGSGLWGAAANARSAGDGKPSGRSAETRRCGNADLSARYRSSGAGLGHRYGQIVLTKVSDSACRTGGYGGLSYVGHGDGTQIGAAADREPSQVRSIVLQPGERVRGDVTETVAQNYPKKRCRPEPVDGFRVYVPNATRSKFVKHPTTGCANPHVHLLSHRAYRRP